MKILFAALFTATVLATPALAHDCECDCKPGYRPGRYSIPWYVPPPTQEKESYSNKISKILRNGREERQRNRALDIQERLLEIQERQLRDLTHEQRMRILENISRMLKETKGEDETER